MLIKKFEVADHEKALLFKHNRFAAVLTPGRYRYLDLGNHVRLETFDTNQHELAHPLAKFLTSTFAEQTAQHLESHQLGDFELGLLYLNGTLVEIVPPGSFKLYWKTSEKLELQRVDFRGDYRLSETLLALLGRGVQGALAKQAAAAVCYAEVPDNHVGLLWINGKLEQVLQPSNYGFWKFQRNVQVKTVDLRLQNIEVSGQEILTKDRVSLRLNLSTSYRVADPLLAQSKLADFNDFLYRELQLQLREAVGTKTLDQLLADKDALNITIADGIRARVAEFGLQVYSVGVRDIILPGEMKTILNQVVEAEKAAEANLIKRREETAATRSLFNTAKMMENNPTLMRLKELEVLEKVTERIGSINVYSGLEGVLTDLIKAPKP